jgi:hypothetical protein
VIQVTGRLPKSRPSSARSPDYDATDDGLRPFADIWNRSSPIVAPSVGSSAVPHPLAILRKCWNGASRRDAFDLFGLGRGGESGCIARDRVAFEDEMPRGGGAGPVDTTGRELTVVRVRSWEPAACRSRLFDTVPPKIERRETVAILRYTASDQRRPERQRIRLFR